LTFAALSLSDLTLDLFLYVLDQVIQVTVAYVTTAIILGGIIGLVIIWTITAAAITTVTAITAIIIIMGVGRLPFAIIAWLTRVICRWFGWLLLIFPLEVLGYTDSQPNANHLVTKALPAT